jgi:hypothetical protein
MLACGGSLFLLEIDAETKARMLRFFCSEEKPMTHPGKLRDCSNPEN